MGNYKTLNMYQKILGVIPARGGSKRVPKKNIKKLGGKPLIAYTIEAAEKSKLLDSFVVSTDSAEISGVVTKYGAKTIERPKVLATDWAKTIDVILDVAKKEEADAIMCLQPTSPFRTAKDIDDAINLFLNVKCESVVSVCEVRDDLCWLLQFKDNYLCPVLQNKYLTSRFQDLPKLFVPNGAIYIASVKTLNKYKSFYTKKIFPYIMPQERSIDIDDMDDFVIAEKKINENNSRRKNRKGKKDR
jgi:CMP-N-acetylneuraminic acid synthetase